MTLKARSGPAGTLSDFQRATAEHAFRRLYLDQDSSRRFLVADETGLGKTHVAREVIALTLDHLQQVDGVRRIDIVYVCSNADIAAQNIRKLNVTASDSETTTFATRLSLLITQPDVLKPTTGGEGKPTTFVAFTPATSFQFGWQMGTAAERAVLYVLLRSHLGLRRARATAAQRIFQGFVASRRRFVKSYVAYARAKRFESSIRRAFLEEFDRSCERESLLALVDEVVGRRALTADQHKAARWIVGSLRRMLARAAVHALEPDLVILDEFQRFRDLLDVKTGSEAAELANDLFTQSDARVLLLSATPYKPFTYAEETAEGGGHYEDFLKTLQFLAAWDGPVDHLRADLDALRQAALSGEPTAVIRDRVQVQLRRWIARTERPTGARQITTLAPTRGRFGVQADDFLGYVTLRRIADAVKAPLSVEYWKSAPYFLNFLTGYRVGEHVRDAMKVPDQRAGLLPVLRGAQRIARPSVQRFQPVEWANARMRALAEETLSPGWWQLLWMPPSLPYHRLGGPYASIDSTAITKKLIFSSWVAAPSAIASLLSYEVQRRIFTRARGSEIENTPAARAAISRRLDYRMYEGRPASMSALALFWPQPALASRTDPLDAARDHAETPSVERLLEWAQERVQPVVGPAGHTASTASAVWHWFAPTHADRDGSLASALLGAHQSTLTEALAGDTPEHRALDAHVEQALTALDGENPESERPADLLTTSALLGLGAPGNIAWRALNRLKRPDDSVTELGQWRAAAILASGLRSVFARPVSILLLDSLYAGSGSMRDDDGIYWRRVARYCIDGGLQAVLDEYIHHLAGEAGVAATTDEGLIALAATARRAIAVRESVYRATDIDNFDGEGIAFPSRCAMRFGSARQSQDEARLPEVRAAFNSPFWPFVLATTSVGQEGIDFHWWCHSVVHWDLPGNPVDFEQREGRVDRYKGHAIRKNVAAAHRSAALAPGVRDPWTAVFETASAESDHDLGGLSPCWIFPGNAQLHRRIMALGLSRDEDRWARLQESLALYRLAFGQPRQEDMLAALERRGIDGNPDRMADLRIDLRPPAPRATH
ncbi:MAG: helicase-related protein [Chloroflexi bacterium]|nr:helicase-related protein [Chloroflexota bacterium]